MSTKTHLPTPPSRSQPTLSKPEKHKSDDLSDLNHRIKRLKTQETVGSVPFLMIAPPEVVLFDLNRANNEYKRAWTEGTPFSYREGNFQYLSLFGRSPSPFLYTRNDWQPDENGTQSSIQKSGASTPSGTNVKKISLSAYKNKLAGKPYAKPDEKQSTQPESIDKSSKSGQLETFTKPPQQDKSTESVLKADASKRSNLETNGKSRDKPSNARQPHDSISTVSANNQTPLNYQRNGISPSDSSAEQAKGNMPGSRATSIPPLLSPTLPPTLNAPSSSATALPPLLSPTLPPVIERRLTQISEESELSSVPSVISDGSQPRSSTKSPPQKSKTVKAVSKSASSSQTDLTKTGLHEKKQTKTNAPLSSVTDTTKFKLTKPKAPLDQKTTNSSTGSASKPAAVKTIRNGAPEGFFKSLHGNSSTPTSTSKPTVASKTVKPVHATSTVTKLKYGKHNKKAVVRILNMTSRAGKKPAVANSASGPNPSSSQSQTSQNAKTDMLSTPSVSKEKNVAGTASKSAEKRKRDADETLTEQPAKRARDVSKQPHTPINSGSPPSSAVSSAQKSHQSGSRGALATAMRGAAKSDSQARTPQGTAQAAASPEKMDRSSSQRSKEKTQLQRRWHDESNRLQALGRELKHEAQALRSLLPPKISSASDEYKHKNIIITYVESVLCYMLGFDALDRAGSLTMTMINSWESIMGLCHFVAGASEPYKHIYSLVHQLTAVCFSTIQQRLQVVVEPDDFLPSDGAPLSSETRSIARKAFRTPFEERRCWATGDTNLSMRELRKSFPAVWNARREVPTLSKNDDIEIGKYEGPYRLPLNYSSSPAEAVRLGEAMLKAWAEKESVEWKSRLFTR